MSGQGNREITGLRFSLGSPFLSLVWNPEGILITPRAENFSHGYGPPRRDFDNGSLINPPYGTLIENAEHECLNQCLINRFQYNKYLDYQPEILSPLKGFPEKQMYIEKRLTEGWRLRAQVFLGEKNKVPFICYSSFVTEPVDEKTYDNSFWKNYDEQVTYPDQPGVQRWGGGLHFGPLKKPARPPKNDPQTVTLEHRQFASGGTSLIYEEESDIWYCHWPQELLYDNDAYEAIYQRTNYYRSQVGRDPVIRELRGFANPARIILHEMQRAQVQFHEHPDYRQGYEEFDFRLRHAGINHYRCAENLVSGVNFGRFSYEAGFKAVEAWSTSPPHYAEMVSDKWDVILKYGTSLDVFGGTSQITKETGAPYPNTYDPPITGSAYAQVFTQRQHWLRAGTISQTGIFGRTSTFGTTTPVLSWLRNDTTGGSPWELCFGGRFYYIQQVIDAVTNGTHSVSNVGSCIFEENNILFFRVILTFLKLPLVDWETREFKIHSYKHPVNSWSSQEWVEEDVYTDEKLTNVVSTVSFTPDGRTGIFSVCKVSTDWPTTTQENTRSYAPGSESARCANLERVHIQVIDGVFSELETVVAPTYTATFTGSYETARFRQYGTGQVDLYPAYDDAGVLKYLQCNYAIDCNEGPNVDNFFYSSDVSVTFPSSKTVVLEYIRIDNPWTEPDRFYYFDEPSFVCIVLYLNVITEDIVYLKYNLTAEDVDYGGVEWAIVHATVDLYVNDTLVKSWTDKKRIQAGIIGPMPISYDDQGSDPNYGLRSSRYLSHRNGAYRLNIGFDLWNEYTEFVAFLPSTVEGSSFGWGQEGIQYYVEDAVIGTNKISLGGRSSIGEGLHSGITNGNQWLAYGFNPLFNVVDGSASAAFSQVVCDVARYQDKLVVSVQLGKVFSYIFYGTDTDYDLVVYANFDLEELVGLNDLNLLIPMGVI